MIAMPKARTPLRPIHTEWPALMSWGSRHGQSAAVALLGASLGAVLVGGMFSEVWEAHDQAHQSLAAAQAQWTAQGPEATMPEALDPSAHPAGALWPRLPGRWSTEGPAALRQFLIQQGLQVQSLRALPEVSAGPLQGQTLAIRMTGLYADWVRAWQILSAEGPVVSMERMNVSALAQPLGVQLDVVLHLWSRPGVSLEASWPMTSSKGQATASGPDIFATAAGADLPPAAAPSKASEAIALTDDPKTWPLDRMRWLGTWQQGADQRAVLSAGGPWVSVRVGQRIGQEGYRVASIGADGLVLQTVQGQRIELKGGGR
jgi:hypothetical protein